MRLHHTPALWAAALLRCRAAILQPALLFHAAATVAGVALVGLSNEECLDADAVIGSSGTSSICFVDAIGIVADFAAIVLGPDVCLDGSTGHGCAGRNRCGSPSTERVTGEVDEIQRHAVGRIMISLVLPQESHGWKLEGDDRKIEMGTHEKRVSVDGGVVGGLRLLRALRIRTGKARVSGLLD